MTPFNGAPQSLRLRRSSIEETPPAAITGIDTALASAAVASTFGPPLAPSRSLSAQTTPAPPASSTRRASARAAPALAPARARPGAPG